LIKTIDIDVFCTDLSVLIATAVPSLCDCAEMADSSLFHRDGSRLPIPKDGVQERVRKVGIAFAILEEVVVEDCVECLEKVDG
jgi:hypothetical protein